MILRIRISGVKYFYVHIVCKYAHSAVYSTYTKLLKYNF